MDNAKKLAKKNPELNAHALAYASMPETAAANPFVKQQYINGHFYYAHKAGILSNGLGIVRDIAFFDEAFKSKHPEVVSQKTDNPEFDEGNFRQRLVKACFVGLLCRSSHFFIHYLPRRLGFR